MFTLAEGQTLGVKDIAFSPDGKRLATDSSDTVQVWDPNTGEKMFILEGGGTMCVWFSPDGSRIETGSRGGVRLCDAATGKIQRTIKIEIKAGIQHDEICRVGFGGDGKQILSVGWSRAWTWDAATGDEIRWTGVGLVTNPDRSIPNTRAINRATNQIVAANDN